MWNSLKSHKLLVTLAIPVACVALLMAANLGFFEAFPAATLKAIRNDSNLVLYSLDPRTGPLKREDPGAFHGWPILGQTILGSSADRSAVAEHLRRVVGSQWS